MRSFRELQPFSHRNKVSKMVQIHGKQLTKSSTPAVEEKPLRLHEALVRHSPTQTSRVGRDKCNG
jgi:hypothetical protein